MSIEDCGKFKNNMTNFTLKKAAIIQMFNDLDEKQFTVEEKQNMSFGILPKKYILIESKDEFFIVKTTGKYTNQIIGRIVKSEIKMPEKIVLEVIQAAELSTRTKNEICIYNVLINKRKLSNFEVLLTTAIHGNEKIRRLVDLGMNLLSNNGYSESLMNNKLVYLIDRDQKKLSAVKSHKKCPYYVLEKVFSNITIPEKGINEQQIAKIILKIINNRKIKCYSGDLNLLWQGIVPKSYVLVREKSGYAIYKNVLNSDFFSDDIPSFDSIFDTYLSLENLSEEMYRELVIERFIEAMNNNENFKGYKSLNLKNYVVHHQQEIGRLQLVPKKLHESQPHIGGKKIWGGKNGTDV